MGGLDVFSENDEDITLSSKSPLISDAKPVDSRQLRYRPWKPLTFGWGVLIPLALFTAGLAALLGLLQWQNARNGAVLFATAGEMFSPMDNFLYRFCPTIIVVLYGICWSWVDLDVKRLEPWLQLAQNAGSSARTSLLLHYPVDFLPFVPFKAVQRRQWSVLCASMVTLLVAWGVTPLQNGIFRNDVVNVPRTVDVVMSTSLLPLADQSSKIDLSILHSGYSILWLGQSTPAFTTAEYALAPFYIHGTQDLLGSNHTLSAQTTMYSTDLECKPPAQVYIDADQVTFDDGDGCVASDLLGSQVASGVGHYQTYYIGYYDDPHSDYSLQMAGCPPKSAHSFLAVWESGSNSSNSPPDFHDPSNATALFCKPSYYTQSVNATVSLPDFSVISADPIGPRTLLTDLDFNITQFEYLLANGILPPTPAFSRQDIADTTVVRQDSKMAELGIVIPVTNMIGFAVGSTHFSAEDYLDPTKLGDAFQRAHRLLFSLGVQNVFEPFGDRPATIGLVQSACQAVTVVPVFAILSQAFLALIAAVICLLLYLLSRRSSKLASDPDSLAQVMAMSTSQSLQELFACHDRSDDKALASALDPAKFRLSWLPGSRHPTLEVISSEKSTSLFEIESSAPSHHTDTTNDFRSGPVQPIEYSLFVGLPLCLGLATMITLLVFLRKKAVKENGISMPFANPLVQQVVLNYIPTALATLLEPTWVLLTRLACMMRPLEELRNGNAQAQKSLLLKYTSIPPPLVLWRALKSWDVILVVLTFTAISANILTVALSGLFTQSQIYRSHAATLQPMYLPRFLPQNPVAQNLNSYTTNDAFYVALANFTNQTSLPSWTSQHYYFLPFQTNTSEMNNDAVKTTLQTPGFGADLECQEMTTTPSDAMYAMEFNVNASLVSLITTSVLGDGSIVNCTTGGGATGPDPSKSYLNLGGDSQGRKALELAVMMQPLLDGNATLAEQESCSGLFLMGWVRANFSSPGEQVDSMSNLSDENSATVSSTFMSCRARPKSAVFNITISPSGGIVETTQISRPTYDLAPSVDLALALANTTKNLNLYGPADATWHNDLFASDWLNYLFKTLTSSTAFLDAGLSPPSFEAASVVASETYSRVFAIQLSLQSTQLAPAPPKSPPVAAELLAPEVRVFMSEIMFYISLAILSLDLAVAVGFYLRTPRPFLPRLPTTIASQLAYFAGSHVIDDVQNGGGDLSKLDKHGYRYGYGKYIGKDGRSHVGIERVPYVTKLTSHGGWSLRGRVWQPHSLRETEFGPG